MPLLSSLSFHYSLLSISSVLCGRWAFHLWRTGFHLWVLWDSVCWGTDAGTDEDNSGKNSGSTNWSPGHMPRVIHNNTSTNTSIKSVTFCPHLEILWDMVAPLYLLSACWATGPPGRAWSHRNEAPGCEEGSVADGWQALWLWSAEDRGVCWWNQLGEKWRLKGERWLGWHWRWRAWLEEWSSLGWWSEDLRRHKKDTEESVGRTSKRHLEKAVRHLSESDQTWSKATEGRSSKWWTYTYECATSLKFSWS